MPRFSNGNGPNDPYRLSHPVLSIEHMFDHRTTTEPTPEEPDGRSRTSADAAVEVAAAGGVRVCSGSFEVLLEQLIRVVDAMGSCVVPADSAALIALRAQVDRVSALITEAEVRFDAAELWRDEGATSMRAWFADRCGLGRRAANDEARRTERLELWPEITDAWVTGRLNRAKVDLIVGVIPRRFRGLFAQHAVSVVETIAPLDMFDTETALRHWVRCAQNPDGPEQLHQRPSGLHFDRALEGQYVLTGNFDATGSAIIEAALHDFDVPDPLDENGNPIDANGNPIGEQRTAAQRKADALIAACHFAITHREGVTNTRRMLPHVSLIIDINELRASALRGAEIRTHADLETRAASHNWTAAEHAWFTDTLNQHLHHQLHGTATTYNHTELDTHAIALLTCDSVVQKILTADNTPLDMGREVRTATIPQRRAIIARDKHCRAPSCHTKPEHCDIHHIDHWINGGKTNTNRMVLLCATHHRQFHRPGYRMELDEHANLTVHTPKGSTRTTTPTATTTRTTHPRITELFDRQIT